MQRFLLLLSAGFLALSLAQSCYDSGDKLINGRCYKLVKQQLSFNDARNWCHYSNPQTSSYLATVADQTTDTFLASYARTAFNTNEGHFWIGLSRPSTSSRYQWDSGTPFAWSNFELQTAQNYVAESIANGKWSNYGADARFNFVCSYDPNAPPTFSPNTDSTVPQSTQFVTEETSTATPDPWSTFSPTWGDVTPTPTDNVYCDITNTTSTFLFAYSTQMNPTVVANVKSVIVEKLNADARRFVKFADVRYDSNNGSTIYYHDTVSSFSSSVDSHPPSKSLVFPDWTSNTDIFPVLESFLNNANSSLCGSFAVVLMKRYNQTGDDFGMFPELLTQRITVNFIQSNYMPEQGYIGCMRHVAGHSGGLFVESGQKGPENDASFPNITRLLMGDSDRLIYSSYPSWLGNVTNLQLEQLKVPKYGQKFVNVTLAVTAEILTEYSLQSITLKIVNRATSQTTSLIYTQKDYYGDSDLIWKTIQLETGSESDVYLDFRTSYGGIVAIRMFIDKPLPGDWNQPEAVLWNANRRNLLAANPAN